MSGLQPDQVPPQMWQHGERKLTVHQLSAPLPEIEKRPPEQMRTREEL